MPAGIGYKRTAGTKPGMKRKGIGKRFTSSMAKKSGAKLKTGQKRNVKGR